jgi:hypothetical protein
MPSVNSISFMYLMGLGIVATRSSFKIRSAIGVIESTCVMAIALALLFATGENAALTQAAQEPPADKQVALLIEKSLQRKTEQQAFSDLETLGCAAVPAIIKRMDDRRKLPVPRISLRNKSPDAFEGMRHYSPQVVVDALAAILSQITGQGFGFISNGATEAERTKTIQGWRDFLKKTAPSKLCDAG